MLFQELLDPTKELCRFPIVELLGTEELLQLALFRGRGTFDQLLSKGVIGGVSRRSDDEVTNFCGKLLRKKGDNVVEFCPLRSDATCAELGLDLLKLHFLAGRPKWQQLQVDSNNGYAVNWQVEVGHSVCGVIPVSCRHSSATLRATNVGK